VHPPTHFACEPEDRVVSPTLGPHGREVGDLASQDCLSIAALALRRALGKSYSLTAGRCHRAPSGTVLVQYCGPLRHFVLDDGRLQFRKARDLGSLSRTEGREIQQLAACG
jgi:hypothetical protein